MTRKLSQVRAAILVTTLIVVLILPSAAYARGQVHIVQRGDTLYNIAARYGTSVQCLMQANGLSNPNLIWVGQRLAISGSGSSGPAGYSNGGVHVVQRGETLYSIARRYGTSVAALVRANNLANVNRIYVGQRLRLPGGGYVPSGRVHIVQRGETLYSIAMRYGTTAWAIASANGLRNVNLIYAGQRLTIP